MAEDIHHQPPLLTYPTYVLLMAGALLSLGVGKDQFRQWALGQARRRHLIDLVRVVAAPRYPWRSRATSEEVAEPPVTSGNAAALGGRIPAPFRVTRLLRDGHAVRR